MGSGEKTPVISLTDSIDVIFAGQCAYYGRNVAFAFCIASITKKTSVKSLCARDDSRDVTSYSSVFCAPCGVWARRGNSDDGRTYEFME